MTRPLFDPARMKPRSDAGGEGPTPPRQDVLTVSALAARVDGAIRGAIPGQIRVVGEIASLRERTHWYFDLRDPHSSLGCVMFASAFRRERARLEEGQQAVVTGRVEYYPKQGRVSIIVERVEPVGEGALDQAFRRLSAELKDLGWFDEERKRPLPAFPAHVAVITSRSGAAVRDVLVTMKARCPAVDVALLDVRVQGEGCEAEIARAVRWVGEHHVDLGIDAIIVTRGGGSAQDLRAFNERSVAAAIVESPVPVVAAIGHETDVSIAELVADARASTPTRAAVLLTPDRQALDEQLSVTSTRLQAAMRRRLAELKRNVLTTQRILGRPILLEETGRRVDALAARLAAGSRHTVHARELSLTRLAARLDQHRPASEHARRRIMADQSARALADAARRRIEAASARLESLRRQLEAVSPTSVLERGYSVTFLPDGSAVRDPGDVKPGAKLTTRVAKGTIRSIAEGPLSPKKNAAQPGAAGLFERPDTQ